MSEAMNNVTPFGVASQRRRAPQTKCQRTTATATIHRVNFQPVWLPGRLSHLGLLWMCGFQVPTIAKVFNVTPAKIRRAAEVMGLPARPNEDGGSTNIALARKFLVVCEEVYGEID